MEERERGKGGGKGRGKGDMEGERKRRYERGEEKEIWKGRGKGDMEGEKGGSKKGRGGDYVSTVPVSCRQVAARVVSHCGDTRPFSCSSCEPT